MKFEYKKGDSVEGWRIGVQIRRAIKELELEEIIEVNEKPFGDIPVLKQIAAKDFSIEVTINNTK